jgi:transcriptional regulator with XRE-family HTH domain
MDELKRLIANRLKSARSEKGLTQGEVADALGMERASYTQIETGRNMLTIPNLIKLQAILGKPITYFLGLGTEDLTAEEVYWLELYRALPEGMPKDYVMAMVEGLVNKAKDFRDEDSEESEV